MPHLLKYYMYLISYHVSIPNHDIYNITIQRLFEKCHKNVEIYHYKNTDDIQISCYKSEIKHDIPMIVCMQAFREYENQTDTNSEYSKILKLIIEHSPCNILDFIDFECRKSMKVYSKRKLEDNDSIKVYSKRKLDIKIEDNTVFSRLFDIFISLIKKVFSILF